jgi:hypothetical protein
LAESRVAFQLVFEMGGESVRQAILVNLFQALEIVDVTVVTLLLAESSLAVDRGAVGDITLTEYSRIGLR